jgi:hypothetical protein
MCNDIRIHPLKLKSLSKWLDILSLRTGAPASYNSPVLAPTTELTELVLWIKQLFVFTASIQSQGGPVLKLSATENPVRSTSSDITLLNTASSQT